MITKELHVISSGASSIRGFAAIARDIHPYVTAFHLRDQTKTARELMEGIELLLAAGVSPSSIIVNDRVDVAAAAHIKGVHLAYHSLHVYDVKQMFPQLRVGKSVHSYEEAAAAAADGADYVFYGHVFPTSSKPGIPARGIEALKQLTMAVDIPIIAIGGVKTSNVSSLLQAGAAGAAVITGITEAADPLSEAAMYHQIIHTGANHGQSS